MSGSQNGTPWVDADATPESREDAEHFLKVGVDVHGTPAEVYLRDVRRIDPPFPEDWRYVEDARTGEGALLAPLYFDGRIVAVQLIYLTRDGQKSPVDPSKQRFSIEKAPGAVLVFPYSGDNPGVVICDGLEDGATVNRYAALRRQVIATPGVGALKHLKLAKGTEVTIFADGDATGSKGAKNLQAGIDALWDQGCHIWVTRTPETWDANSVLVQYGVDGLKKLSDSVEEAVPSDIIRLALLPLLDYGQQRVEAAKKLGITVAILDKLVERQRLKRAAKAKGGGDDWISVDDTRPWDAEVDGAELLNELSATLQRFVVMSKHQARAVALWVLFTWVFEAAHCALKLWVKSPEKRSGKTRLVEVISYLVQRPLIASGMTVAAFFRLIELKRKPTVLMDEFDAWAKDNQEFRGVINAGFDKRTALKWVCVGDDHIPTAFDLFTPQVIAGIGEIPDTVADRSLKIELERKLRSQKVDKLRRSGAAALDELAQKCARWAKDNLPDLMNVDPEVPEEINDRAADGWELMLAIADQVGGPWPQRARLAAIKLSGDGYVIDDDSLGAQLLHDIGVVLKEHPPSPDGSSAVQDKVPSAHLVKWLIAMEDRPWVEMGKSQQPMTQHQLARLLRKYKIRPKDTKLPNRAVLKGYSRAELLEKISHYVTPDAQPAEEAPEASPNGHDTRPPSDFDASNRYHATSEDFRAAQPDSKPLPVKSGSGLKKPKTPRITAEGSEVAVANPENSGVARAPVKTREQTIEQFRRAGDMGLGSAQMDHMRIDDDVIDALIAEGILEEFDDHGRRVRYVEREEPVAPNGADDAAPEEAPPAAPQRRSMADEARRLKAENPKWSIRRIASELMLPEKRVQGYLEQ